MISATCPFGALGAVLGDRRDPGAIVDLDDRSAHLVGQVIAHRVADPALPAPVQQLVRGAGAIDAQQQLDRFDVLGRDLSDRLLGDGDLVGGGVGAGVAGPQLAGERLPGLIGVGEHRVKAEAALEVARRTLLVGMTGDQRRVQIDRQLARRAAKLPRPRPRSGKRSRKRSRPPGSLATWSTSRNAVDAEATCPNSGA